MGYRRVLRAALGQAALFGCGTGVLATLSAHLYAGALVLGLLAMWIAAAAAWQGRLRAAPRAEPPRPVRADDAESRLLSTLLDQTPAPLLTRDAEGVVQARNRAARRLFRTDGRVVDPPAGLLDALAAASGTERLTFQDGDGAAPRTYAIALADILSTGGPLRLAVLLDIEPEVRAAEAKALRELLQVLSHEIMNALTPVASLADTAVELMTSPAPEAQAQAVDAVGTLARRARALARFAEDYRRLARLPAPVRRPVLIDDILAEVERLSASRCSARGVRLTAPRPPAPIGAELDPDQIVQAVLHLVTNGTEAVGAGGTVVVTASAASGRAVFRVQDDGAGVRSADRERIFQPFFTTKPDGSGIGLSLARQIARAHGGELTLVSDSTRPGAAFELTL